MNEFKSDMTRTRIKFCGFTRADDMDHAISLGVDAVGLVCVPASRRALSIEAAAELRARVPAFVSCVVLLLDAEPQWIETVIERVRPDLLQFHGQESGAFCRRFGRRYVKAIGMAGGDAGPSNIEQYVDAAGLMLDGHVPGALGGTGESFDWPRAQALGGNRLILAGGLHADNVAEAIAAVHPFAVDVSSGIEVTPGVKDSGKMNVFVDAVRRADAASFSRNQ